MPDIPVIKIIKNAMNKLLHLMWLFLAINLIYIFNKMIETMTRRPQVKNSSLTAQKKKRMKTRVRIRTGQGPTGIGEILSPLIGIKDNPDRINILQNYFSGV